MSTTTSKKNRTNWIIAGSVGLVCVVLIAGGLTWHFTRPENADITEAEPNQLAPFSLLRVDPIIGEPLGNVTNPEEQQQTQILGNVSLSTSFIVGEPENTLYFLTIRLDGWRYRSSEVRFDLEPFPESGVSENALNFGTPIQLPKGFDPTNYVGGSLSWDGLGILGTVAVDDMTSKFNETDGGGVSSKSIVLRSELEGWKDYNVAGTIEIKTRSVSSGSSIADEAYLELNIKDIPRAPDARLYLSKEPLDRGASSLDDDKVLFIEITGHDSSPLMAKKGEYFQDLTFGREIDLNDFKNGSFIVWCKKFTVYLGGGEITSEMV